MILKLYSPYNKLWLPKVFGCPKNKKKERKIQYIHKNKRALTYCLPEFCVCVFWGLAIGSPTRYIYITSQLSCIFRWFFVRKAIEKSLEERNKRVGEDF